MNINQNYKIVDVSEFIKYANNSRTHSKEQIEQIAKIMAGFLQILFAIHMLAQAQHCLHAKSLADHV
jgi:hypothetical protein